MEWMVVMSVFAVSFVFSMFGMGGGLIFMPLFMNLTDHYFEASAYSFMAIFATSFSAMIAYHRQKLIDWSLVRRLGLPLAGAVFLTGHLAVNISFSHLKWILSVVLMAAGTSMMMFSAKKTTHNKDDQAEDQRPESLFMHFLTVVSGLLIGLFSGLASVAGGVFEIPLIVHGLRKPAHVAVATSSVTVVLASLLGFIGRISFYPQSVEPDIFLLIGILMAAVCGGSLGPLVSLKAHKDIFKKLCGAFVFVIGAAYLLRSIH